MRISTSGKGFPLETKTRRSASDVGISTTPVLNFERPTARRRGAASGADWVSAKVASAIA
jgi:hypothetical protein